jgi:glutamine synthetase
MFKTSQEFLQHVKDNNIQIIDLKFIDMPGTWQHLSVYHNQIDESS